MKFLGCSTVSFEYLKKAFSDKGAPSSSRLLAGLHSLAAIFCLVYVTLKTRVIPDGTVLAGLAGFSTAPYLVNRASNMFVNKVPAPTVSKEA